MLIKESARLGDIYFELLFSYLEYDIILGSKRIVCLSEEYLRKKENMFNIWNCNINCQTELITALSLTIDFTYFCPAISQELMQEAVKHANSYCFMHV